MPQYRAVRTFRNTSVGPPPTHIVRTGVVLTMSDKDAATLNRQVKMLEPYGGPREAPDNRSLPGAPRTKIGSEDEGPPSNPDGDARFDVDAQDNPEGNEPPPPEETKPSVSVKGARQVGGRDKRSSAPRVGRPLPRKT